MPDVSVVVVNYRQAALASRCVESVHRAFESGSVAGEILLIDCGSGPEEAAALEAVRARVVRLPDNRGYSGGVNAGLALALADRIVLSNADVEFLPRALSELIRMLDDPRVGACAPVCFWDKSGNVLLPPGFDPGFLQELAMLSATDGGRRVAGRFAAFARDAVRLWTLGGRARHLSGAVLAVRRDVFDRAGRFDERFLFEYEETEWERRVEGAGFELHVAAGARVRHLWGASAAGDPGTERRRAASRRFFRESRYGRVGRALLERAERRVAGSRASRASLPRRDRVELPAMPGAWVAMSPNASRIPFAAADLSQPFRVPVEIRAAAPPGEWFWTIFSATDGQPIEAFTAELA